jgi:hypothetical protein
LAHLQQQNQTMSFSPDLNHLKYYTGPTYIDGKQRDEALLQQLSSVSNEKLPMLLELIKLFCDHEINERDPTYFILYSSSGAPTMALLLNHEQHVYEQIGKLLNQPTQQIEPIETRQATPINTPMNIAEVQPHEDLEEDEEQPDAVTTENVDIQPEKRTIPPRKTKPTKPTKVTKPTNPTKPTTLTRTTRTDPVITEQIQVPSKRTATEVLVETDYVEPKKKRADTFDSDDTKEKLAKLLGHFKKLTSNEITIKNFEVKIQSVSILTKDGIANDLQKLKGLYGTTTIAHNLECWLIYHYFDNHARFHPNKKLRREMECGECNQYLYEILHGGGGHPCRKTMSQWVNRRKKIGLFLSLLHAPGQGYLEMYYDGDMTSLISYLDELPNLKLLKDAETQQTVRQLISSILK